jgi:hypothetical protein
LTLYFAERDHAKKRGNTVGWWSDRQARLETERGARREAEVARQAAERRQRRELIEAEQKRIQSHLKTNEEIVDFLVGTYWDAQHYIAQVVDRPEGTFNMWDSRYVKMGSGSLVLTKQRIMFAPDGDGRLHVGAFAGSPRDKSYDNAGPLTWIFLDPTESIEVPEKNCFMVCFDGRSLPKVDEFGFFATNSPRIKEFERAVAETARRARTGA